MISLVAPLTRATSNCDADFVTSFGWKEIPRPGFCTFNWRFGLCSTGISRLTILSILALTLTSNTPFFTPLLSFVSI